MSFKLGNVSGFFIVASIEICILHCLRFEWTDC